MVVKFFISPRTKRGEPAALTCAVEMNMTTTVVRLIGELDLATAPVLLSVIDDQIHRGRAHVHLDLDDLTFCDGRGVATLVDAKKRLQAVDGHLTVLRPSPFLRQIAEWAGQPDLFTPDALASA